MRVIGISTYPGRDNKTRWKVTLQGDDRPLILREKPTFKEGYEIPAGKLLLQTKGDNQWYIWKEEESVLTPREAIKEANIAWQVILKAAVDLYCHVTEPGKGINQKEFNQCYDTCRKKVDQDKVVSAAKDMGAQESGKGS